VTATLLDGKVVAAFWGAASETTIHLGMLAHSPVLSEHSPGKLHLMDLSAHLIDCGRLTLDLTPGGDPWKERFANAHDEVAEVTLFRSAWKKSLADASDAAAAAAKRCLAPTGLTPATLRSGLAKLRRLDLSNQWRKLLDWAGHETEFRVYRGDRAFAEPFGRDERVCVNSLSDLLAFEPGEAWQTRQHFLADALARLEAGDSAYTIVVDGRLAHVGWISWYRPSSYMTEVQQTLPLPEGSVALYDFFTHPEFRGRGLYRATISHMLADAFGRVQTHFAYISVLADNGPSRHVIEDLGFAYQGSLWSRRRLGRASPRGGLPAARVEAGDA
jgi:RimJ/RimL family protein N-acetyltransferase